MICRREFLAAGPGLEALKEANARAVDFVAGLVARGYRAVILARDLRPGEFSIVEAEGGRGFVVEFVRMVGEPVPVSSVPEDSAL